MTQFQPLEVYLHKHFLVRGAANDFTMDKRRLFQNETHFIFNPVKGKMNELFDEKEFVGVFQQKYKQEWSVVQARIVELVKKTFAVCIMEAPGLQAGNVGSVYE